MWSMALRWLPRRLLNSLRSVMMWSIARRCSSRLRRCRSSVLTRSRKAASDSSRSADAVASGLCWSVMGHDSGRSGQASFRLQPLQFLPLTLQLPFQGDHLELAADDDLLEFLEVQDLLLQFRLGLLEVADDLLVGTHVAQDADGPDHPSVGVAQSRGVERRGDDFPTGAAGVEDDVARDAAMIGVLRGRGLARLVRARPCVLAFDDLAQRGQELAGFFGRDDARERLLDQLVRAEAQQGEDRVVGLEDFALEVRDEHRVRGVFDQALRVRAGLVELAHVAEHADGADHLAFGVAQSRGVERRGDDLPAGAPGVEARVARHTPLHHLAQRGGELPCLLRAGVARERLLEQLVLAEAEELRDRVVGL